jgi:hypothetical protein
LVKLPNAKTFGWNFVVDSFSVLGENGSKIYRKQVTECKMRQKPRPPQRIKFDGKYQDVEFVDARGETRIRLSFRPEKGGVQAEVNVYDRSRKCIVHLAAFSIK